MLARLQSTMSSILGEQTHIFKRVGENQDFMLVIDSGGSRIFMGAITPKVGVLTY